MFLRTPMSHCLLSTLLWLWCRTLPSCVQTVSARQENHIVYLVQSDSCPVAQSDSCIVVLVWWPYCVQSEYSDDCIVVYSWGSVSWLYSGSVVWLCCGSTRQMYGGSVRQFIVITISCMVLLSDNWINSISNNNNGHLAHLTCTGSKCLQNLLFN